MQKIDTIQEYCDAHQDDW